MPPRYLRKGSTKLKSCSEFKVEACDIAPADQCCGALPCTLCLELETYADGISYGTATFGGSSWTGTVGGLSFVSYWERDAYGECEYVVTLDGEEVYRATCYEGASCRDPGGSVGVLIGYDEGTLTWTKHEPRPLAVTTDPDTGCNDFFCGTCRCTCDCLCVTITEPDGNVLLGEICSTSYPCDAPIWEGSIGYYDLSAALGRDDYTGECIISLTASGEGVDPVFASGCGNMSASVELYDGTVIAVACKQCSCEVGICGGCCPEGIPKTLYLSGGVLGSESVALTCENCNIGPCDDATLKQWKGSFITGWYYMFGYGSMCTILSRWYFRAKLEFIWTCGSGYNLTVSATVFEEAHITPGGPSVGSSLGSDTQNVDSGCDPLLNIFNEICVGNGWMLTEPAVHCAGDPPGTVRCPQEYIVTV